ncbi:metallophosphoesterase [Clostridium sartagoforme]|jgi:UDP-2,3-diacylglucosamine pyrophosphatase LpxH|uniref:metallophosphoesterase n=1 Tax=Clostridium sartagoforme TaxID=84031 RepID=UPI0031D6E2DB
MKRLDYLYDNSMEIKFDEGTNIVFISDVHRGDGTFYDSMLPNINIYKTALSYYYRREFIYVEVGDGDELWKNRNYDNISYCYNDIFKLFNKFKEENRIYMIYGNHDIIKNRESFYHIQYRALRKIGTDYGKNFLDFIKDIEFYEGINFKFTPVNEKFLVTHGHQVDLINSDYWLLSRFLVRYVWKFLNGLAGFKDPISPAKNNKKGSKVDRKLEKWSEINGKMLICGHTHNSRMPAKFDPPYFNDGCCILPYAMTAIEIESGSISLVKWSVESQESGVLWVRRKVIVGPNSIKDYLLFARDKRIRIIEESKKQKIKQKK